MKTQLKLALAVSAILSTGNALALPIIPDMQIDVGTNSYEVNLPSPFNGFNTANDSNSRTASFKAFGFTDTLATSLYASDSQGNLTGSFFDTNINSELAAFGITPAGLTGASLGGPNVTLKQPVAGISNSTSVDKDITTLSPLVPPNTQGVDSEGFGLTWDMRMDYHLNGILGQNGPAYTGGYLDLVFNNKTTGASYTGVTATLTGSSLNLANLDLFFNITSAASGFLWVANSQGILVDVSTLLAPGQYAKMTLHTNVVPPVPTLDQLLLVNDGTNYYAARQSQLSGTIDAEIPEPSSIALLGLGLLGFGAASRVRKQA